MWPDASLPLRHGGSLLCCCGHRAGDKVWDAGFHRPATLFGFGAFGSPKKVLWVGASAALEILALYKELPYLAQSTHPAYFLGLPSLEASGVQELWWCLPCSKFVCALWVFRRLGCLYSFMLALWGNND